MFGKILIANRGEIACRVIRTAHRMGVATVAVYSTADAHAPHVKLAGEARAIGGAPARESYLDIDRILQAARDTGAQAIHPGYGFLSENADFADACAASGIVFIGPPASSMRAMGSKAAAKALMARAGVPLVPGYHGEAQDGPVFAEAASDIGYPVLIKASSGGGGRGMRVVSEPAALADALEGAAREAVASFGDGRLLLEKYLTRPRHIEIQVFADTHRQLHLPVRTRLLHPAPPPEGAGGIACSLHGCGAPRGDGRGRGGRCPRGGLCRRRHGRIHRRG